MAPRKLRLIPILAPQPKRRKPKLTTVILSFFAVVGCIIFYLGLKLAAPSVSSIKRTKSLLPTFVKPAPHLLPSKAALNQVNLYVNLTISTGSFRYQESSSCKTHSNCEIHFPYLDLETASPDKISDMQEKTDIRSDLAVLTRKGSKALVTNVKVNQDRSFIISPLELGEETSLATGPDDFMVGLFDGHGELGHGTAHFAAMELPPLLLRTMQRQRKFIPTKAASDDVVAALKESFVHLDDNIPFLETSGSTGIIILRVGNTLFFGSTGDSQAFLVKADTSFEDKVGVSIVHATVPHKPEGLEAKRIISSGGQVMPKTAEDVSARVVITIPNALTLALAMSRCLGDAEGKKQNVLIADPNVDVIDLDQLKKESSATDQYFVVAASDGLLDRVPPLLVAQRIAMSLYKESPSQPLVACQDLIQESSMMWGELVGVEYRDDISIAVKRVHL